ncbi:urease accessory protein UreE [Halovenus sp. HT40]|uniref:urease accessory protein UreE n=1 Tax=Halovenus sp. HT40 TaxID=3126691 RepID=UPI00300EE944
MEQIDGTVGNRYTDSDLGERVDRHEQAGTLEVVRIEAGNRKRSRLRVETDNGTDLGVVLDDPLRAGDVLAIDDERAIVVEFERRDAAVIDLPHATPAGVESAAELGHRIGNQHWDLAIQAGSIYVPVEADPHIIEDVLAESLPEDTIIEYEEVDPAIWIDDASAEGVDHNHGDAGHGHSHGDAGHDHSRGDGHTHGGHDHTASHVDYRDATDAGDEA